MKIHILHTTSYDFKNDLYNPLRNSDLNRLHKIFLPHETDTFINTKNLIKEADIVVAEVSFSSTGLGIELGWADSFGKPIICAYKRGAEVSKSLKTITEKFIEYSTPEELIAKLSEELKK